MNRTTNIILAAIAFCAYGVSAAFASVTVPSEDFPKDVLNHFRWSLFSSDGSGDAKVNKTETFALNSELTEISIEAISADIEISEIEGDQFSVTLTGKAYAGKIPESFFQKSSHKITVLLEKPANFGSNSLIAKITVPKNFKGKLSIDTVSSDIQYSGLKLLELKLKTISGDVRTDDCNSKTVTIYSVSGDVTGVCAAEKVKINTTSGDFELDIDKVGKSAEIRSVSGDLKIRGNLKDRVKLDFKSTSGDISGADFINVKSGYGSSSAEYSPASAKVELKVRSVSGDIEVL